MLNKELVNPCSKKLKKENTEKITDINPQEHPPNGLRQSSTSLRDNDCCTAPNISTDNLASLSMQHNLPKIHQPDSPVQQVNPIGRNGIEISNYFQIDFMLLDEMK